MDEKEHSMEVGSNGIDLRLEASMDCGGIYDDAAGHTINWPYNQIADVLGKVLNGEKVSSDKLNHDKYFPSKNSSAVFSYGKEGVSYNSGNCASGCGDEPHAGWKFWFDYDWIDDYDLVFSE